MSQLEPRNYAGDSDIAFKSEETLDEVPSQTMEPTSCFKQCNKVQSEERCAKLLKNLGWGTGFKVPFANAQNRQLETDLELKQRRILSLKLKLNDSTEHITTLEQNLERIREDCYTYQHLVKNKRSLFEEEQNFCGLAERIYRRLAQDKSTYENAIEECKKRSTIMQKDLDRRLKGILELRDLIDFDSETLNDYQQRIKDFEEIDTEVRKLGIEDEKRVRELEDARAELGAFRKELRRKLDQEAMNTAKFHEQFDRLSVEFRKVHRQRQDMVAMWGATIQAMKDKDDYMQSIADEYYENKKKLRKVLETIEEKEKLLQIQTMGIKHTEMLLSEIERCIGDKHQRVVDTRKIVISLKDAYSLCRTEIEYASNEIQSKIKSLAKMDEEIAYYDKKYRKICEEVCTVKDQLAATIAQSTDSDAKISELEAMLDLEEKAMDQMVREMDLMKKFFWERSYDKTSTVEKITNLETTIVRVQNNLTNMQSKSAAQVDYISRRSSVIYKLDLECSLMENRIRKMTNQSVDPNYFNLQNKFVKLQNIFKKITKEHQFIATEFTIVTQQTKKCNADVEKNRRDHVDLKAELRQCVQLTHGLEKFMEKSIKELNCEQVRFSLERVYLKRLTNELKTKRQEMYGLAEIRNTIHWAVKERKAEIENHKLLNLSRQLSLNEAVSKLRAQVSEVCYRTEKLRGRFELVSKLMSGTHDVNPEQQTLAYQVRKAARERELVQQEQGNWKMRLEEAEKELEGIKNVHTIMHASNETLKESLAPAGENSPEMEYLQELSAKEQDILMRRNRAKKYRTVLRDRRHEVEETIAVLEKDLHSTQQLNDIKEDLLTRLDNELHRQKDKIVRWHGICAKLIKEIRTIVPGEMMPVLKLDMRLRFTRSKYESALGILERFLVQHPNTQAFFEEYTLQAQDSTFEKIYNRFFGKGGSSGSSSSSSSSYNNRSSTGSISDPNNPRSDSDTSFSDETDSTPNNQKGVSVKRMSPQSRIQSHQGMKQNKSLPPTLTLKKSKLPSNSASIKK